MAPALFLNKRSNTMETQKISIFKEFESPKQMDEYITALCYGKVEKGSIYILLGMYEQTIKNGFKKQEKEN
tara:strand:+ start:7888 stop:8100 length:213 start_codon:yes stop_codon:yes gene_type:complete